MTLSVQADKLEPDELSGMSEQASRLGLRHCLMMDKIQNEGVN